MDEERLLLDSMPSVSELHSDSPDHHNLLHKGKCGLMVPPCLAGRCGDSAPSPLANFHVAGSLSCAGSTIGREVNPETLGPYSGLLASRRPESAQVSALRLFGLRVLVVIKVKQLELKLALLNVTSNFDSEGGPHYCLAGSGLVPGGSIVLPMKDCHCQDGCMSGRHRNRKIKQCPLTDLLRVWRKQDSQCDTDNGSPG